MVENDVIVIHRKFPILNLSSSLFEIFNQQDVFIWISVHIIEHLETLKIKKILPLRNHGAQGEVTR